MATLLRGGLFSIFLFLTAFSSLTHAEQTQITLLEKNINLSYQSAVRLEQALKDAFLQIDYGIYPLGIALINPNKKDIIDKRKSNIIRQLKEINTTKSLNVANQLNKLSFMYREHIDTDINKIRAFLKLNPLISGQNWLSLPKRPTSIFIIHPNKPETINVEIKQSKNLKDILKDNNVSENSDAVWVVQPDQNAYQAKNFNWKDTPFFLAPGATIFLELKGLPNEYQNLNEKIANLLTFRVAI